MKVGMRYWRSSIVLVVVVVVLMGSTTAFASNLNPGVLPPNSHPYGLTYGEWSARWWQWALGIAQPNNPLVDTTGANCAVGQSGPVWFLAGTLGGSATRSCTIPAGKSIMFPIFNVEWSDVEAKAQQQLTPGQSCLLPGQPNDTSDAALQACATAQANHATALGATLEADVDMKTLQSLTNYLALSPPFDFTAVANNPLITCSSTCPGRAVADGFWIILAPLSTGKHTLHFAATVPFPEINFTFNTEVTYNLTVG